jgi:hypothetical protein
MTTKTLRLIGFICAVMLFSSCKKEGCTDKNATNYSPDADQDDGTCKFEGQIVFWYSEATATWLVNEGSSSLTYYFDGVIVGSSASNVFWTAAPACGANSSITVTKDMGLSKTKSYTYSVVDGSGVTLWTGTVTLDANTCLAFQLTV